MVYNNPWREGTFRNPSISAARSCFVTDDLRRNVLYQFSNEYDDRLGYLRITSDAWPSSQSARKLAPKNGGAFWKSREHSYLSQDRRSSISQTVTNGTFWRDFLEGAAKFCPQIIRSSLSRSFKTSSRFAWIWNNRLLFFRRDPGHSRRGHQRTYNLHTFSQSLSSSASSRISSTSWSSQSPGNGSSADSLLESSAEPSSDSTSRLFFG